ncbi:MAG: extracellular solute-binding protein [Chloroflexi bacterium]|nr:extracellular solute-binding protein [Chloroflexota bacterium]MCY3938670.1 extracellular solute-binding protein [Chloroflexota bacterium]
MKFKSLSRRKLLRSGLAAGAGVAGVAALAGCGETQVVEVVKEVPVETVKEVVKEVPVEREKVVTKVVEKVVTVEAMMKAKHVELELWNASEEQLNPIWASVTNDFMAANANVTVKRSEIPFGDMQAKILTALAGGLKPDVVYSHPQLTAKMASSGALKPLDDLMRQDQTFDREDFNTGSIEANNFKGKAYVLPSVSAPLLNIYNRDLVEPLGMGDPWELQQSGEWTRDVYSEMITKMTTGEGDNRVFGGIEVYHALKIQYLWVWGEGGAIWDNPNDPVEFVGNSPEALAAWDWMTGQAIRGETPAPDYVKAFQGGTQGLFVSGKLGFYLTHRQYTYQIPEGFNGGVAPMYKHPNGDDQTRDAPEGLGIHASTEHEEEAWALLKYLTTVGIKSFIAGGVSAPTLKSHQNLPEFVSSIAPWDDIAIHKTAASQIKRSFHHPIPYGEINKLVQTNVERIILGEKEVKEGFDEIKPKIDDLLAEFR